MFSDEEDYPWDLEVDADDTDPRFLCPYCGAQPNEAHTERCPLTDPPLSTYDA